MEMAEPSSSGHANRYRIVVDTCADLTPEIAATLDVDILGFPYIVDGQEKTDDIWASITPKEFYDQIRSGVKMSTSAISLGRYLEFFTECAKEGTPTVYLCFTSALSGRRMGFVFNDTVVAAPRIYTGLESGQFLISGPDGYDMSRLYKSMLKEKKDSLDALFSANGWLIDTLRFSRLTPGEQDSLANMLDYSDACRLVEGF